MHPQAAPRRVENLAFVFQELLTVGERLRSNRQQVADAVSFRAQRVNDTGDTLDPMVQRHSIFQIPAGLCS